MKQVFRLLVPSKLCHLLCSVLAGEKAIFLHHSMHSQGSQFSMRLFHLGSKLRVRSHEYGARVFGTIRLRVFDTITLRVFTSDVIPKGARFQ